MLITIVISRNLTKLYDNVIDESKIIDKRSKDNKDTFENVLIDNHLLRYFWINKLGKQTF